MRFLYSWHFCDENIFHKRRFFSFSYVCFWRDPGSYVWQFEARVTIWNNDPDRWITGKVNRREKKESTYTVGETISQFPRFGNTNKNETIQQLKWRKMLGTFWAHAGIDKNGAYFFCIPCTSHRRLESRRIIILSMALCLARVWWSSKNVWLRSLALAGTINLSLRSFYSFSKTIIEKKVKFSFK